MALSAFDDRSAPPSDGDVATVLGPAARRWERIRSQLALTEEWGFASRSTGWGLRLKQGSRVIVYLTPRAGSFLASLALGERAVAAAREQGLPGPALAAIDAAPRYAEGRGVRLAVSTADDVETVRQLAAVKLAN